MYIYVYIYTSGSRSANAIPFVGFPVTYHERFRHNATMCLDTASALIIADRPS